MDDQEKNEHTYYEMSHQDVSSDSNKDRNEEHFPTNPSHQDSNDSQHIENSHALRTLLSWHAPAWTSKSRGREYYINILLITLFLSVILLLFHEYLLILVLFSLLFFMYALSATPPGSLYYKISTEGVMVGEHFYIWEELYDFYFKQKDGHEILHIRTKWFVPGELMLVLGDLSRDHVRDILLKYLPFREYVKPTFTEKTGDWFARTFPLERR